MEYINFYGSVENQSKKIKDLEIDLLFRKVVLLANLSDFLSTRGLNLYFSVYEKDNYGISFLVEHTGKIVDDGINNLNSILMTPVKYGLSDQDIDKYIESFIASSSLEEKMKFNSSIYKNNQNKILIDKTNTVWISMIFESCGNKEYYSVFMAKVLEKNLRYNEEKIKKRLIPENVETVIGTLNNIPLTQKFDSIIYIDVLEHIENLPSLMMEFHRVCVNGAIIEIIVPHCNGIGAFQDPTHRRFYSYNSFEYFTKNKNFPSYNFQNGFESVEKKICFVRTPKNIYDYLKHPFKAFFELTFNYFPNFYENSFLRIFPATDFRVKLRVIK